MTTTNEAFEKYDELQAENTRLRGALEDLRMALDPDEWLP